MDYHPSSFAGPSSASAGPSRSSPSYTGHSAQPREQTPPKFDIIHWYGQYQSCLKYFVEVAQHSYPCQALAAFVNIKLPFQRAASANASRPPPAALPPPHPTISVYGWVSLHPYIRRLVATGFDAPAILHGWFGNDWVQGVGPLHEQERRNYLFAAKSGGWLKVKQEYDTVQEECCPYIQPLGVLDDGELEAAEGVWSKWLAMEDWMLGGRAPDDEDRMEGVGRQRG